MSGPTLRHGEENQPASDFQIQLPMARLVITSHFTAWVPLSQCQSPANQPSVINFGLTITNSRSRTSKLAA
jgi:hypothetical protein